MNEHPLDHPPEIVAGADATFRVDAPSNHPRLPQKESGLKKRLFSHNRWMLIMSLAIVGIAIAIATTIAFQAIQPDPDQTATSIKPTPQPTPATTRDEGDNTFFAAQPLSMVYYSFSQTTNNKNVFQATPNQNDVRFVDTGLPERYDFLSSPDGKSLARWTSQRLEVSDSSAPSKFSALYSAGEALEIVSVVWRSDSQAILVSTSTEADEGAFNASLVLVELSDPDKTSPIVLEAVDYKVTLLGFSDSDSVYFSQNRGGLQSSLTLYSLKDKKIIRELPELHRAGLLSRMQFDRSLTWGYWVDQNRVKRRNLNSGQEQVVFEISRQCGSYDDNASMVRWASPSPSGNRLVLLAQPEACRYDRQSDTRNRLIILDSSTRRVIKEVYDQPVESLIDSWWSPDETLVWLQVSLQQAYLLTASSLDLQPVPPADTQVLTKERLLFMGWLTGSK